MGFAKRYTIIVVTVIALGLVMYQIEWYLEEQEHQRKLAEAAEAEQEYQRKLAEEAKEAEQDYQRKLADAKEVKITHVSGGSDYRTLWGGPSWHTYVDIENQGTSDVDGLTLVCEFRESEETITKSLGLLRGGSEKTVEFGGLGSPPWCYLLMFDDIIVNEYSFG